MLGNTNEIISQKLSFLTSQYKDLDLTSSQKDFIKLLFIVFRDTPCLAQNKCSINRVYRKSDSSQKPLLYCFFDLNELGEIFYYLDDNSNSFVQMSKEEFDKNFDCYIKDLRQSKGKKPWEKENTNGKKVQNNTSLDRSDV